MSYVPAEVDTYFRRHPSYAVPTDLARRRIKISDVSQSEEGIRTLALANQWSAVIQLAEALEKAYSPNVPAQRETLLRLQLARVTALVKVGEYQKAHQILSEVGDCAAPVNVNPETGLSIVPFSMVFLAAYLPSQWGETTRSITALYSLLEECQEQEAAKKEVGKESVRWRERQRRVRRALVILHQENRQFEAAFAHLSALIDMSADLTKQMLLMQQLGCLALKNGNAAIATSAFKKMKQLPDDDEEATAEAVHLCRFLSEMNDALLNIFWGEFDLAIERFRKLMALNPYSGEPLPDSQPSGAEGSETIPESPVVATAGSVSNFSLAARSRGTGGVTPTAANAHEEPFTRFNVAAANAFLALHLYATDEGQFSLKSAIAFAENIVKRHPTDMLNANATLYNLRTIYALEGDEVVDKAALLRGITDYFRCGPECFPSEILP